MTAYPCCCPPRTRPPNCGNCNGPDEISIDLSFINDLIYPQFIVDPCLSDEGACNEPPADISNVTLSKFDPWWDREGSICFWHWQKFSSCACTIGPSDDYPGKMRWNVIVTAKVISVAGPHDYKWELNVFLQLVSDSSSCVIVHVYTQRSITYSSDVLTAAESDYLCLPESINTNLDSDVLLGPLPGVLIQYHCGSYTPPINPDPPPVIPINPITSGCSHCSGATPNTLSADTANGLSIPGVGVAYDCARAIFAPAQAIIDATRTTGCTWIKLNVCSPPVPPAAYCCWASTRFVIDNTPAAGTLHCLITVAYIDGATVTEITLDFFQTLGATFDCTALSSVWLTLDGNAPGPSTPVVVMR
jgi:hypothetical protein